MPEATLEIRLVDDGTSGQPALDSGLPQNPPPRPGPPSTRAAGPSISARDTDNHDTQPMTRERWRGSPPAPKERWRGAPEAETSRPEPSTVSMAATFAQRLASQTGLGGLATQVAAMVRIFADFTTLMRSALPKLTAATVATTAARAIPALPRPAAATLETAAARPAAPAINADLLRQQGEVLERTRWHSGSRALHFDVEQKNHTKTLGPTSREAAEAEFRRQADAGEDKPQAPIQLARTVYDSSKPEQGAFRKSTARDVEVKQASSLNDWRAPKALDLSKLQLGKLPEAVNLGKVSQKEAAGVFQAAAPKESGAAAVAAESGGAAGTQAAGALGRLATTLGPVGVAAAATTAAVVGLGLAAKKVVDVFRSQADRLESYSGHVAVAKAESEIRRQLDTLSRAQKIGPQVAQWERTGSRVDSAIDRLATEGLRLLDKLASPLQKLGDGLASGVDQVTSTLSDAMEAWEGLQEINEINQKSLSDAFHAQKAIPDWLKRVYEVLVWHKDKKEEEASKEDPFLLAFLAGGREGVLANMPTQPAAPSVGLFKNQLVGAEQ